VSRAFLGHSVVVQHMRCSVRWASRERRA